MTVAPLLTLSGIAFAGIRQRDRPHLRQARCRGNGADGKGGGADAALARQAGLDALFLLRDDAAGVRDSGIGTLFSKQTAATATASGG